MVSYMADCSEAVDYVLSFEDPTLSGVVTTDSGGRTRYGIAERFHPDLAASLFYTSLGSAAALVIARGIYETKYGDPLCLSGITSQAVANKLLSLGVNIGVIPASKMLQNVLHVEGDGRIGPITLHALDISDPETVLEHLRADAEQYYRNLVAENPKLQVYLNGWLKRAAA